MKHLTVKERALIESLPKPPPIGQVHSTNVWIIEWLDAERRTGLELHEWMQQRRRGWSKYQRCGCKRDVLAAIDEAQRIAAADGVLPVLHLEAHGCERALEGPDGNGGRELLSWQELIAPLQRLNVATRCNLVVFFAACIGFAGVLAMTQGPRAPAVAIVGPDDTILPSQILAGAKEFYRRWMDKNPRLGEICDSASQEVGSVAFEPEPFVLLCYEAMVERIVISSRPEQLKLRLERVKIRLATEANLTQSEIAERLEQLPLLDRDINQHMWNSMFMLDLYPENAERFALDVRRLVEMVQASASA